MVLGIYCFGGLAKTGYLHIQLALANIAQRYLFAKDSNNIRLWGGGY